ncbi:hypothetical protein [Paenibacillus medicaginis]|uniref:Uncharacterized protein n=1 Tax=Paenibacillus medicaginis TaxID=1470560 RepID=A0ABV5BUM1_9BACL
MLKGWIAAPLNDKYILEEIGIVLGQYNSEQFEECIVADEVMEKLDQYWGHYWWGLHQMCDDQGNSI